MNNERPDWLTDAFVDVCVKYDLEITPVIENKLIQITTSKDLTPEAKKEIGSYLPKTSLWKIITAVRLSKLMAIGELIYLNGMTALMPDIKPDHSVTLSLVSSTPNKFKDPEHILWSTIHYILHTDGFAITLNVFLNGVPLFTKNIREIPEPVDKSYVDGLLAQHASGMPVTETPTVPQDVIPKSEKSEVKKRIESVPLSRDEETDMKIISGLIDKCNTVEDFLKNM